MNKLNKIALGAWAWGQGAVGGDQVFGNNYTANDFKPVFDKASELGFKIWDTAAVYGMGSSEAILGGFIKEVSRDTVYISTKFTPQIANGSNTSVEDMLNGSLERLQTNYVDIYWIHNPADVERWTPYLIPLLKSGKVKDVGVSNHNLAELKRAEEILKKEGFRVSAVQNHYSLLNRSSEESGLLEYCNKNDITFYSYMVLEQGALSGKYNTQNLMDPNSERGTAYNPIMKEIELLTNALKAIGNKYSVTVAQIAIAWAIAKNTLPIIGVTKVEQVIEAYNTAQIVLKKDDIRYLEDVAKSINVSTIRGWEKDMNK